MPPVLSIAIISKVVISRLLMLMSASGSSTKVEHSPCHFEVKGSEWSELRHSTVTYHCCHLLIITILIIRNTGGITYN